MLISISVLCFSNNLFVGPTTQYNPPPPKKKGTKYVFEELRLFTASISQEEEDGSDEDSVSSTTVVELPVPPPCRTTRTAAGEEDSDRDSDPAFVSPLDEVKGVHHQAALTMANLHEASRSVDVCTASFLEFLTSAAELKSFLFPNIMTQNLPGLSAC